MLVQNGLYSWTKKLFISRNTIKQMRTKKADLCTKTAFLLYNLNNKWSLLS